MQKVTLLVDCLRYDDFINYVINPKTLGKVKKNLAVEARRFVLPYRLLVDHLFEKEQIGRTFKVTVGVEQSKVVYVLVGKEGVRVRIDVSKVEFEY